jgi:translation initiation factor IF-3
LITIAANNNVPQKGKNKDNQELLNSAVRFPQVRLIGPDGEQLGTMSSREAQFKANELDLDLLCVAPNATPPVCKLLNYNKYRYEQQKKAKLAKKNQKIVEVKEIQLTPQIGFHDMETKARNAIKFFQDGNKVKVGVRFRGRQMAHQEVGQETINKFIELVAEYSQIEKAPSLDGRWLIAILAPKKQ